VRTSVLPLSSCIDRLTRTPDFVTTWSDRDNESSGRQPNEAVDRTGPATPVTRRCDARPHVVGLDDPPDPMTESPAG
jgi:hypothetical protein